MPTLSVVEDFDVFEQAGPEFIDRTVILRVDQFDFQATEERFHHRIVPAVAFATHARLNPPAGQGLLVLVAAVLHTTV